jgi:hypothetical protein
MNQPKSDLDAVIPTRKTTTLAGEVIVIAQIKVGALPAVLAAVQPLSHLLMQKDVSAEIISSLFLSHGDDALNLLSALSGKPRKWVDALELDDAIALFIDLLEVNLDFFIQRVLPLLTGGMQELVAKLQAQAPGQTQSTI